MTPRQTGNSPFWFPVCGNEKNLIKYPNNELCNVVISMLAFRENSTVWPFDQKKKATGQVKCKRISVFKNKKKTNKERKKERKQTNKQTNKKASFSNLFLGHIA